MVDLKGVTVKTPKHFRADLKAIGRRIRQIRGFGMSKSEFGKALGIRQRQLSKYETGQSAPTLDVLLRLRYLTGKSIDWVLTGEDEQLRESM